MSYLSGPPSRRQFFKYLQAHSNKTSLGDHEILWEKGSISLDERQIVEFSGKRGVYANSLSGPLLISATMHTYWLDRIDSAYLKKSKIEPSL